MTDDEIRAKIQKYFETEFELFWRGMQIDSVFDYDVPVSTRAEELTKKAKITITWSE